MLVTRLFTISFIFLSLQGLAQNKKDVKEADKKFKKELYAEVLPEYKKFINMNPTNVDFVYKYGACVVMTSENTEDALKYLLKAEELGKNDNEIAYFIGRAYEKQNKYEKALEYYERFKATSTKEEAKKLKLKKRIKSCKKGLK